MLLTVMKVGGLLLGTILGLLAVVSDYRVKETGRITRAGRLALIGIVVSGVVALLASILEAEAASHEKTEQIKRFAGLYNELARGQLSLDHFKVGARFKVPPGTPLFTKLESNPRVKALETGDWRYRVDDCESVVDGRDDDFPKDGPWPWLAFAVLPIDSKVDPASYQFAHPQPKPGSAFPTISMPADLKFASNFGDAQLKRISFDQCTRDFFLSFEYSPRGPRASADVHSLMDLLDRPIVVGAIDASGLAIQAITVTTSGGVSLGMSEPAFSSTGKQYPSVSYWGRFPARLSSSE